ncbi:MAG: alpha/beta fold hydrolase [Streptosporangiales bacterium]|nr:alpha/beta fold hydrolase [Streptosporangiales bacterium]
MLRGSLVVIVVVAVLLAVLWAAQRRLIYFPDASTPAAPPGVRAVTYATSDELRLGAWLVPAARADGPVVLFAPGNAGNRAHRLPLARALAERGVTVLLVDYRGYGGNPGNPTEEGLARDVAGAHAYLTSTLRVPPERLVYVGESLGAAVVARLAVARPPAGLVLRSPFTSLADVGARHYPVLPVGLLLRDRFPVSSLMARIEVPTTVVYGAADTIVPAELSRQVAAAAGGPVRRVEVAGANHNDVELATGPALVEAVVAASP